MTGRNDHSDKRSEDDKRLHAWFRQCDEIRRARRSTGTLKAIEGVIRESLWPSWPIPLRATVADLHR